MTLQIHTNHIECVKCLHEHGVAWNESVTIKAVEDGTMECLQYLLDNAILSDSGAMVAAVRRNRLDAVQGMRAHGVEWNELACTAAAGLGCLQCLQYLLDGGCPCSATAAIQANHLACVTCMHEHGVAWDKTVTLAAAENSMPECLQFLLQPSCPASSSAYVAAIEADSLRCVEVLHSFALPWDETVIAARRSQIIRIFAHSEPGIAPESPNITSCNAKDRLQASEDIAESTALWRQVEQAVEGSYPIAASVAEAIFVADDYQTLHLAVSNGYVFDLPANVLASAPRCGTYMAAHVRKLERSAKRKAAEQLEPNSMKK